MTKHHFKMYYTETVFDKPQIFFEATFDAPSTEEAWQFGHALAKLYVDKELINPSYNSWSHEVSIIA